MDRNAKKQIEHKILSPAQVTTLNLSQEVLTLTDYRWLANIIIKSSFLETIHLPPCDVQDVAEIIAILHQAIQKTSILRQIDGNFSQFATKFSQTTTRQYQQINGYLHRNNNRIFAIHGGGNIGLGLMADVITRSPFKYKIIATTNKTFNRDLINSVGKLWLRHGGTNETSCIDNVQMISRLRNDVISLYVQANLMAICLTTEAFELAAQDIATGLMRRYEADKAGLKIFILMNLPNCAQVVAKKLKEHIYLQTQNLSYTIKVLSHIEFLPTVIDRIVTPIPPEQVKNYLCKQLVPIIGNDISEPQLIQAVAKYKIAFNLFSAEKNFSMFVPNCIPEIQRFPAMSATHDLAQIEFIKNKYMNGPHAILAWLGALMGYATIAEAMQNSLIAAFMKDMLTDEIKPIIKQEFPDVSNEKLDSLSKLFFSRVVASTEDSVFRVGRDPLRKLNTGAHIRGTIELAQKHRLYISTAHLELGIAAGIVYAVRGKDLTNSSCLKIREIYTANGQSYAAVLAYHGAAPNGHFTGLDVQQYPQLVERILSKINWLNTLYDKQFNSAKVLALGDATKWQKDKLPISKILTGSRFKDSFFKAQNTNNISKITVAGAEKMDAMRYQKKLSSLGIILDPKNGHLSYDKNFTPLPLSFELIFTRHGETFGNCGQTTITGEIDYNLVRSGAKDKDKRVFQGAVDLKINQLTKQGKEQAVELAEKLKTRLLAKGWVPDVILLSPLTRAQKTAWPFIEQCNFKDRCIVVDDIREIFFGAWENKRVCDMPHNDPCHLFYRDQNALVKALDDGKDATYPAENFCDVILRAENFLRNLNDQYAGKKIMMFSHSMFGAACSILLGQGQQIEEEKFLAFDGKSKDNVAYIMPHSEPIFLNCSLSQQNRGQRLPETEVLEGGFSAYKC